MEALNAGMQGLNVRSGSSCASDSQGGQQCEKPGVMACKDCLMVAYCSKNCQVSHWPIHRRDCRGSFMKKTWEPSWITQHRRPAFLSSDHDSQQVAFGTRKYLWGNVPGIDLIRLDQNEGVTFQGPIRVLLAASRDLRNAVLSVVGLPSSYRGTLNVVLNDRDVTIVARNAILLLIFFVEEDPVAAAEHSLHTWYSALITASCHDVLLRKVKPLVESVCDKIAHKSGSIVLGKTWTFGENRSLRLVLTRDNWFSLLSHLDTPQGFTKDAAQRVRQRVVAAPERVDYVDGVLCVKSPTAKFGMMKFRQDGILLPFGQSRRTFVIPNPTLFHSPGEWPMTDNADPTIGWSPKSFLDFNAGPAKNDEYGKLYHYLIYLFEGFHRRLHADSISFELLQVDPRVLPKSLMGTSFDRIDVSNICDIDYIGIGATLRIFGGMLRPISATPHATLITLFLHAVSEMPREQPTKVLQYMPELDRPVSNPYDPTIITAATALSLVYDMDKLFNSYMKMNDFESLAIGLGLEMKATHTVINPWPMTIAGGRPTAKAREDFAILLASRHTGQERYVEWKRTAMEVVEDVP
ncbi:hypothetical protein F4778DRAFT_776922 [Xylariomycetidae sp. FL2044]|nr:hypothetical protein F4778DRAFT_776922 [Xylariomycetidae sp. FL2044]